MAFWKHAGSKPHQYRSLRIMRAGFVFLAAFFIVFLIAYSVFSWQSVKQSQFDQLSSIAELGGNSLESYFSQYEREMNALAREVGNSGVLDRAQTLQLLKRFLRVNPDILIANLNRADGQLLVSSEVELDKPLPFQGNAVSYVVGKQALENGANFDIGRATYGPLAKGWVIPLRYAIRDKAGKLQYVLVAVLPLSRQQSFWHDMKLPEGTAFGLIRNDAFLISRYPDDVTNDRKEVYGKPRTGVLIEHLRATGFPLRGTVSGFNSINREAYLFGYKRLENFPVTLFVTTPVSNVYASLWAQVRYVYFLLLLLLPSSYAVYRKTVNEQLRIELERDRYEGALRTSEERFRRVVAEAPVPMMIHAENGEVLEINKAWTEATGYSFEDIPDISAWIKHAYEENTQFVQDAKNVRELIERVYGIGHRVDQGERTIHCKDGSIRIWHFSAAPVGVLPDGRRYVVSMAQDISESKAAQQKIEFMSYHDALTGLPNRLLAKNLFEQAILDADRDNSKVALLFVDLDKFKTINDSLGHLVGDALLTGLAGRLRACLRDVDTLSRQGGDEFLIALKDVRDSESITVVTDKLMESMAEPVKISGHELSISLSIGIAVYPDDGQDFETLLKKSDTAMYQAKESGRNTYRFHTEQMNLDATEHLRLRNGLRRALEQGEFLLHYQPQLSVVNGEVVGVEALLRWQHPELGMVPPGKFISIAEDSGLIVPISEWVIREACRQAIAWQNEGLPGMVVAVNLSAVHFKRGDVVQSALQALQESGLEPSLLEFELTESILIKETDKVMAIVRQLKSMGVKLSIDDFGTGYSSLSYLKQFNVDKLKIDQSFIRDMADDPNDAAIVRAIIQMAKSLNLETIAEGVEDERQLALLRLQQCDEVQGFYFAKPMPADALAGYLREFRKIKFNQ